METPIEGQRLERLSLYCSDSARDIMNPLAPNGTNEKMEKPVLETVQPGIAPGPAASDGHGCTLEDRFDDLGQFRRLDTWIDGKTHQNVEPGLFFADAQ